MAVAAPYLDHPRPLAFAHRGGAAHKPENSWLAFEYAARLRDEITDLRRELKTLV